ncbi:MAG TPA: hypothetical protein VGL20_18900 [Candidatus Dormibacteraeota bacterium]|jgi:hypothetical protein
MGRFDCPLCRARLDPGATHCARCGVRVAALERRPRVPRAAPARRRPPVPGSPAEAARLGLAGGVGLVGLAALVGLLTRLAGGDGLAGLGNASLLLGMATLGMSALLGGVRVSRWVEAGRGGGERLRRRARGEAPDRRTLLRLGIAVAGAVPFVLFVVLAAAR